MGSGNAFGIASLSGGENGVGVEIGDDTAREEGDGEVGRGDAVREFGDGEDVEGIGGEESFAESSTEGFNGSADGCERIAGMLHGVMQGGSGKADLKEETKHGHLFLGEGESRFGQCAREEERGQEEKNENLVMLGGKRVRKKV